MTEESPAAPTMPACNGSVAPEDGPLQVISGIDEIPKSVGTVPYANAETSPDTSPAKETLEENRNSLTEDITPENFAGEKRCQGIVWGCMSLSVGRENSVPPSRSPAQPRCRAGPGAAAAPPPERAETPAGSAHRTGHAAEEQEEQEEQEEEEEEEEEEDTEEDEVQVIEIKENSEASRLQQRDGGKQPPPLASLGCNSPLEKRGEQPSLGKKNDISRHSYSRYNTISYRRIRKGNTKQRIDEFESMMHL
ncbi:ERMIN protein, partial [Edolisoma coerulescens]|nr:ERMIN protein [Edolisoma coerulescens]